MAQRYKIPQSPLTGDLRPRQEWTNYFAGIEEIGNRVAVNVDPLAASPTVEQISTAFNALLTALKNSKLQNTE